MWTIENSNRPGVYALFSGISDEAKQRWWQFQKYIQKDHVHPKEAANRVGTVAHKKAMGYKELTGKEFQIRLSGDRRAVFLVEETSSGNGKVTVLQVGGHTKD